MSDAGKVAVIGASARVRGRIAGDEDVVIHGRVEGEIDLRGALRVEVGGVVRAQVRAAAARIRGVVVGDVVVTDVIHLAATARVIGDVRAARLVIEPGAQISGAVTVEGEAKADAGARRSFGSVELPRARGRTDEHPRAGSPRHDPPRWPDDRTTEAPPAARAESPAARAESPAASPAARAESPTARVATAAASPAAPAASPTARVASPAARAEAPTAVAAPPIAVAAPPIAVAARDFAPTSWRLAPRVPDPRPIAHATMLPADEPARSRRPGPPTVEPDPPSDPPRVDDASEREDALPHPSVVLTHRPDEPGRRRVLVKLRRRGEGP